MENRLQFLDEIQLNGILVNGIRRFGRYCLFAVCLVNLACASAPALAGFVKGSYQIDIGESERLLEAQLRNQRGALSDAELHAIETEESCKNPSQRLIDRNRPAILLQNTSALTPTNEISQFVIDLEEIGFEFGTGDFNPDPFAGGLTILSNRSDAGVSISSSFGTVSDVDLTTDRSKLVLDISGLTPGKALIFRFDLDPNPMTTTMFPDYRQVMLGANTGSGPATPSLISATFASDYDDDERMTTSTNPTPFVGEFNGILSTAGLLEGYHSQGSSQMFGQNGGTEEIPEPSTAVLLFAGFAGLSLARRNRR